jgi:hypothetical protein
MDKSILAPAAVLVLWTLIILAWAAFTRLTAITKSGGSLKTAAPGGRGVNLEGVLPDIVNWKSHNYAHLVEQPTLFYAIAIILAVVGASGGLNTQLAWAYVGLRIAHSLWQAMINTIPVRFTLFLLSTLCLLVLAINALRATLGA